MQPRRKIRSINEAGESSASSTRRGSRRRRNDPSNVDNAVPAPATVMPEFPSFMELLAQQIQRVNNSSHHRLPQNSAVTNNLVPETSQAQGNRVECSLASLWQREYQKELNRTMAMEEAYREQLNIWRMQLEAMLAEEARNKGEMEDLLKEKEKQLQPLAEIEAQIERKEQELLRFRERFHYYETKSCNLETSIELYQRRVVANGVGCSMPPRAAEVEDEQSVFDDPNKVPLVDLTCQICRSRQAIVILYPCKHLCVCLICEASTTDCPVCNEFKVCAHVVEFQ